MSKKIYFQRLPTIDLCHVSGIQFELCLIFCCLTECVTRRLSEGDDTGFVGPEVRQQFGSGGRNSEETRGYQCGHHRQGEIIFDVIF